jgi:glycosyltransferase involved in cell wall biosynthesis
MSVSVVVPCHNEAKYIEQCIKSIIEQSDYNSIKGIFVIDDGSTDETPQILKNLKKKISKLNIITTEGVGVSAARNIAIKLCKSEFIALLDADDYWHKDKIKNQLKAFNYDPSIGLVFGDYWDFSKPDASDSILVPVRSFNLNDKDQLIKYFLKDAPIIPSATIYRREALFKAGFFNEKLKFYEDSELNLRIVERWKFLHVRGGLLYKRKKKNQMTARLDKLINDVYLVSEIASSRNPKLKKFVNQRNARYLYKSALDCYTRHKEKQKALKHSISSLKLNPFAFYPWILIIMIFMPYKITLKIYNSIKKIVYKFRN